MLSCLSSRKWVVLGAAANKAVADEKRCVETAAMVVDVVVSADLTGLGPGLDARVNGVVNDPIAVVEKCHGAVLEGVSGVRARTAWSSGPRGAMRSQRVEKSFEGVGGTELPEW